MSQRLLIGVFALAILVVPAAADGIADVKVDGNRVEATIDLGVGVAADLTIRFEKVVGLTESSLGLSAELVDPLDLSLLSRLPDPGQSGIPAAFPVRLAIEPPVGGALAFGGVAEIEIYTHTLTYDSGTPLRLVSAPVGGTFRDISEFMGTGSYRVRGSKGDFSEFLIIADLRSAGDVIESKFEHLEALLADNAYSIEPQVYSDLQQLLAGAETAWLTGDRVTAIDFVEEFSDTVSEYSGGDIPDVWRASRDLTNVAGRLRAAAATLRFSLNL